MKWAATVCLRGENGLQQLQTSCLWDSPYGALCMQLDKYRCLLGIVCDGSVLIAWQQDWLKNNYIYTDFFCIFLQKLSHGLCQERNVWCTVLDFFSLISPSVFGKALKCGLVRRQSWHFTFLAFFYFISLFLVPGLWLSWGIVLVWWMKRKKKWVITYLCTFSFPFFPYSSSNSSEASVEHNHVGLPQWVCVLKKRSDIMPGFYEWANQMWIAWSGFLSNHFPAHHCHPLVNKASLFLSWPPTWNVLVWKFRWQKPRKRCLNYLLLLSVDWEAENYHAAESRCVAPGGVIHS